DERLGGGRLLRRREPGVGPDDPHLGARMGGLCAEGEGVEVTDDLGDAVGHHVADHALLGRGPGGHAGQIDGVLGRAEVLGLVLLDLGPGCLLEQDVRILVRELAVDAELEHPERGAEDHLVAVANKAGDDLGHRRVAEDVLLVGRLNLRAEGLLHRQAAGVMRLRPAPVVVRPRIDPGDLERRLLLGRLRRSQTSHRRSHDHQARDQRTQHVLPLLHELFLPDTVERPRPDYKSLQRRREGLLRVGSRGRWRCSCKTAGSARWTIPDRSFPTAGCSFATGWTTPWAAVPRPLRRWSSTWAGRWSRPASSTPTTTCTRP